MKGADRWHGMLRWHAYDLTGGAAPDPRPAARLSEAAKEGLEALHLEDPQKWTVERLAEEYGVRQQRVMAILALRRLRAADVAAGRPLNEDFEKAMLAARGSTVAKASGEAHVKAAPSYPTYTIVPEGPDGETLALFSAPRQNGKGGAAAAKKKGPLTSEAEEAALVREFRANLDYNSQKTGTELLQGSRLRQPATRPSKGWTLVVRYMGEEREPEAFEPGSNKARTLTPSETTLHLRQKSRPRRRIIP